MNARTMGWLAVVLLALAASARAQQPAGPVTPAAGAAMQAAADDADAWGDDLFAFSGDELAWGDDDDAPGPGPGGMHGAMGMGPGGGMHGGMGTGPGGGMHGGPGMGPMRGGPGGGRPGMRRGPGAHVFAQLDLTPAQREKLADLHERQMRSDIQARADMATGKLDLHKLMRAEKPDKAAIDRQIDRMAALRATRQKSHVGTMLEARALLTPEQQKKARELHLRGGRGMQGQAGPGMRWQQKDDTRDLETPKR